MDVAPEEIDVHAPVTAHGLNSVDMVGVTGELEVILNHPIDPSLLLDCGTVAELASALSELSL